MTLSTTAEVTDVADRGRRLAQRAVHDLTGARLPDSWDQLTATERKEFEDTLTIYLAQDALHPGQYTDRAGRAREVLALVRA